MSVTTTPAKRVSFISRPVVKIVAYLLSWFLFSLSLVLLVYSVLSVAEVGGACASGNTAYAIAVQCPQDATAFLPWVIFSGLIAVAIAVVFANGIGVQPRVWAWPILFGGLGAIFVLGGGPVGWGVGGLFIVMALVPLALELKASVQRVFLGSFNVFGQQFRESPKAQPSFSSRTMPNPPDAITPSPGAWLFAFFGFAIPCVLGYMLATAWVNAL
jgi:hypothetical protein